jgi:hypothetical protein
MWLDFSLRRVCDALATTTPGLRDALNAGSDDLLGGVLGDWGLLHDGCLNPRLANVLLRLHDVALQEVLAQVAAANQECSDTLHRVWDNVIGVSEARMKTMMESMQSLSLEKRFGGWCSLPVGPAQGPSPSSRCGACS